VCPGTVGCRQPQGVANVADAWRPANELERRLRDALLAGDAEGYFRLLAEAELLVPVPPDLLDDVLANESQPTWPTQEQDGRTYVLAFTSPLAMRAGIGSGYQHFVKLKFADVAENWPDPRWWLTLNLGAPIEGRLPSWFITQLAQGDHQPPQAGLPGALARPAAGEPAGADYRRPAGQPSAPEYPEQQAGRHASHGRPAGSLAADHGVRAREFRPANDVERELLRAAGLGDQDAYFRALAASDVLLLVPDDMDYTLRPGRPGFPWQTREADGATVLPVFTSVERIREAIDPALPEYQKLPFGSLMRYWPDQTWGLAVDPHTPVTTTVPGEQIRNLSEWTDRITAQRAADGFEPQNDIERRLYDAAARRDQDAFVKVLLSAQVLIPADPETPWGIRPDDPEFPWRPTRVHGNRAVQVFTSLKWMHDAIGSSRFVMPGFLDLASSWPDTDWSLVINPGTPIDATVPGDRVRALGGALSPTPDPLSVVPPPRGTVPGKPATAPTQPTPGTPGLSTEHPVAALQPGDLSTTAHDAPSSASTSATVDTSGSHAAAPRTTDPDGIPTPGLPGAAATSGMPAPSPDAPDSTPDLPATAGQPNPSTSAVPGTQDPAGSHGPTGTHGPAGAHDLTGTHDPATADDRTGAPDPATGRERAGTLGAAASLGAAAFAHDPAAGHRPAGPSEAVEATGPLDASGNPVATPHSDATGIPSTHEEPRPHDSGRAPEMPGTHGYATPGMSGTPDTRGTSDSRNVPGLHDVAATPNAAGGSSPGAPSPTGDPDSATRDAALSSHETATPGVSDSSAERPIPGASAVGGSARGGPGPHGPGGAPGLSPTAGTSDLSEEPATSHMPGASPTHATTPHTPTTPETGREAAGHGVAHSAEMPGRTAADPSGVPFDALSRESPLGGSDASRGPADSPPEETAAPETPPGAAARGAGSGATAPWAAAAGSPGTSGTPAAASPQDETAAQDDATRGIAARESAGETATGWGRAQQSAAHGAVPGSAERTAYPQSSYEGATYEQGGYEGARGDAERAATGFGTAPGEADVEDIEPDFEPGNRIDQELYEAAVSGDTDAFLRVLLAANVLVPIPADAPLEVTPVQPEFRWEAAMRDASSVQVFTSLVRLREALPASRFVYADFRELIGAWPRADWTMLLNPSTRIGASLRGDQVQALSEWAVRVGLIRPRSQPPGPDGEPPMPMRRPAGEVPGATAGQARREPDREPPVPQPVVMQKVLPHGHVGWYLEQGYDRVGGFVHPISDVTDLQSPAQLYAALGLIYDGSPFTSDDEGVYVIRWPAYCAELYRIPFGGQTEEDLRAWGDAGWVIEQAPFQGSGFAPGSAGSIREYKLDSARLPYGAEMYYLGHDRSERFVAMYDPDRAAWLRPDGGTTGDPGDARAAADGGDEKAVANQ
jgi:type III secretion system (T3SS) SseB-like protein